MFRSSRLAFALAIVAAVTALCGASSAGAATVVNGDFETGDLAGWTSASSSPFVEWFAEENAFPAPFGGKFLAESFEEDAGTAYLYQDIALEPAASHQLQMAFSYKSEGPIAIPSPDYLDVKGGGAEPPNQQVRIDVIKPSAPISTLASEDILATLFASSESENVYKEVNNELVGSAGLQPTLLSADLSQFAGQTIRLRAVVAVNSNQLNAYIDNVSVSSTPLPPPIIPAPAPTPSPPAAPSNVFAEGKLTLNKKNGTAKLAVEVPGAGTLNAADVRSKIALGSFAKTETKGKKKAKPILVRSTTVASGAAGIVLVPIRPTAAAKKMLAKKGKLAVKLNLTFIPVGGTAATQIYSTRLAKKLKPAPR